MATKQTGPQNNKKNVLIIIPTYNEVDNIRALVSRIAAISHNRPDYQYDILFVDDESTDGTAGIIRSLRNRNSRIELLSGPRAGLGRAYIRGFLHGLAQAKYFAVVMMDADLSHDPADIPRLLAGLEEGADYVIGSRYVAGGGSAKGYPVYRRLQSTLANMIAKQFVGLKTSTKDLTAGFKAIRYTALRNIPLQSITASGYVFQVSLFYEFFKRDYAIREVPITFHVRQHGVSKLGLRDISEFLRLTYSLNPYSGVRRLVRFICVGALGTVINVAILVSLVRVLHLEVMASYLTALEASIICNFFLNHWFTFRYDTKTGQPAGKLAKLLRYNLVTLGGATIALIVFRTALHGLGLHYVLADLLGILAATSWNYWLSIRLVWPIIDSAADNRSEPKYELRET